MDPSALVSNTVAKVDRYQRDHRPAGFAFAVVKKFGEDDAGNLAALIAYYGFFSLFPLLLVFVTVLGYVLGSHPDQQQRLLSSALAELPVIGDQLRSSVGALEGNWLALTIGIVGALWGGLGAIDAMQNAMNRVWRVPIKERPSFLIAKVRSLITLAVIGVAIVASSILDGIATSTIGWPAIGRALAFVLTVALNAAMFVLTFHFLTDRDVPWRDHVPGGVVAGAAFTLVQVVGGLYVNHVLRGATATYGMFATVLGLLSLLYLEAQLSLLGAEINTVRSLGLVPRSLTGELTEGDRASLQTSADVEERVPQEEVVVDLTDGGAPASGSPTEADVPVRAHAR